MGLVTVFACMSQALSGSGPATTAAIGSVTVPAMKREGYDVRLQLRLQQVQGLGSLIPLTLIIDDWFLKRNPAFVLAGLPGSSLPSF